MTKEETANPYTRKGDEELFKSWEAGWNMTRDEALAELVAAIDRRNSIKKELEEAERAVRDARNALARIYRETCPTY
jgi:hypothetical protein